MPLRSAGNEYAKQVSAQTVVRVRTAPCCKDPQHHQGFGDSAFPFCAREVAYHHRDAAAGGDGDTISDAQEGLVDGIVASALAAARPLGYPSSWLRICHGGAPGGICSEVPRAAPACLRVRFSKRAIFGIVWIKCNGHNGRESFTRGQRGRSHFLTL